MSKNRDFEDDGRTVADMSEVSRPSLFSFRASGKKTSPESVADERPWESSMSREERRATILGALGASLSIGMAYVVGLGAVIVLLLLLWN